MEEPEKHPDGLMPANFLSDLKEIRELQLKLKNEVDTIRSFKMPPFKMPNWPDVKNLDINIYLGLRRVWLLEDPHENRKILKAKKRLLVLSVNIGSDGRIKVTLRHPLDLSNKLVFYSVGTSPNITLQCFIIFSQFIKQIAKRSLILLRNDLAMKSLEKERHLILINSVEETFESFVPFIMADELAK